MTMYPQTATIQSATVTTTDGTTSSTWGNATGLVDISAQLTSPLRGEAREIEREHGTFVRVDRFLYLDGHYPQITEKMRAICEGNTYDIEFADSDSHHTYTRLALRLVR
jgi:hypothetical protein